jgi:hypothetical protein
MRLTRSVGLHVTEVYANQQRNLTQSYKPKTAICPRPGAGRGYYILRPGHTYAAGVAVEVEIRAANLRIAMM